MNADQQAQYNALEAEKATLNQSNPDDKFRLTVIQQEQDKLMSAGAEQERLQQQAEAVASVELPQDYDELWGVSGANDEIKSLVQQAYETAFGAGNDELAKAQEDKATLASQVADLQAALTTAQAQLQQATADKLTAQEAQADAESKRDNAVQQMEEAQDERDKATAQVESLKRQIDELEGMVRTYKSRSTTGVTGGLSGLKFISTIKPESDEERRDREERERVEQLNKFLARHGSEPLKLPTKIVEASEEAPESPAAETPHDDRFLVDQANVDAGELAQGDVGGQVDGQGDQELTLEQKVEALWAWKTDVSKELEFMGVQV